MPTSTHGIFSAANAKSPIVRRNTANASKWASSANPSAVNASIAKTRKMRYNVDKHKITI